MNTLRFDVTNVVEMIAVAAGLSKKLKPTDTVCLSGDLGAGKTFFTQQVLKEMGYSGVVNSPTFSIVETYPVTFSNENKVSTPIELNHFDLYRIESIEELENIGFRDYFHQNAINFIEWPSKAGALLPKDIHSVEIAMDKNNQRKMTLISKYSVSI